MKKLITICAVVIMMMVVGAANALTTTWDVATVHGLNQFSISEGGTLLHYNPQPRNSAELYWYNNNGSPAGTPATNGANGSGLDPAGYRIGSRTLAATDVAV